jgi:hypothetical protein
MAARLDHEDRFYFPQIPGDVAQMIMQPGRHAHLFPAGIADPVGDAVEHQLRRAQDRSRMLR